MIGVADPSRAPLETMTRDELVAVARRAESERDSARRREREAKSDKRELESILDGLAMGLASASDLQRNLSDQMERYRARVDARGAVRVKGADLRVAVDA